jgi:hypothetical protein
MKFMIFVLAVMSMAAQIAVAGTASGTVKSPTGVIAPKYAVGYVVRDSSNPRSNAVELLLTDIELDGARFKDDFDRHATAINLQELNDRNYMFLWVRPDGSVNMNATYSKTMMQYLSGTPDPLKAELTTNTPARIEGRIYTPAPIKTMGDNSYTVDVKFSADILPALTGTPLAAGGGDPGKAFTKFLGAIGKKNWPGIKAGLSPKILPMYEQDYNTPAETLSSAVGILGARLPLAKAKVTGGQLLNPTTALLEMEGERFGSRVLTLVKMVKTGTAWQYEESATVGSLP